MKQITDAQNVLLSKRFVKGAIQYASPSEIFEPIRKLFDKVGASLVLKGDAEIKNAETNGQENVSFGRMALTARFEIDQELYYELGFLVALDLSHPKLKIYRGAVTSACLNLNVFGSDDVVKFEITNGFNMEIVTQYIQNAAAQIKLAVDMVNLMKVIPVSPDTLEQVLGRMTIETLENRLPHGTQVITQAADLMVDKKSRYYYKQPGFNSWLLYNALTENNSRKSAFDIPEKSLSTFQLVQSILNPATLETVAQVPEEALN